MTFNTSADARNAHWFSRRHQTNEAHDVAVANYGTRRNRKARRQGVAEANMVIRSQRTDVEQLAVLKKRIGDGAHLEVAKLNSQVLKSLGA